MADLSEDDKNILEAFHALTVKPKITKPEDLLSQGQPMAQVEMREIRKNQREDKTIGKWVRAVIDKNLPHKSVKLSKEDLMINKKFNSLKMIRGVMYREIQINDEMVNQLVLPECYRNSVLKGLHTDIGHPGKERTLSLIRERFYWPNMTSDIEKWVSTCDRCIRRKSSTNIRTELVSIETTYPLELVCMDYLTLEPAKGGISNILVITDHFTKYALAIPTRDQTAKTTAEALYNNFILHYGIPTKLHSDQGANFESQIIKELCQITGTIKSRTTVYHPMGNGITERYNRTLLGMLGTLEEAQKKDWKNMYHHWCMHITVQNMKLQKFHRLNLCSEENLSFLLILHLSPQWKALILLMIQRNIWKT